MDELDQQESTLLEDEEVHITDLDAPGSSRQQRAARAIERLRQGLKVPWIRYGFSGVLIAILLGAIILQWPRPAPVPVSPAKTPISYFYTGAFGQGTIFIQAYDHSLSAYQLTTGHRQWYTTLPMLASLDAEGQFLYCAFAASQNSSVLEALDTRTGKVVWHDTLPAIFSGTIRISASRPSQPAGPAFVYDNNVLYLQGTNDTIFAIQGNNGQAKWTYRATEHPQSSPFTLYWREALSVHDGFVTFSSTDNATYILDANNGHEVLALPATSFPSFLAIDGQIVYTMPSTFSASYTGQQTASVSPTIQAFHLPDGQRLWSHSFSGEAQIYAETADTIYATEMLETKLTAIQSNDGHKLWTYHASNGSSIRSFITANGFGYLLQADATLVCLRLNDGYPLWQRQIKALKNGAAITATLTMQGDTLLLYDADSEMTSPLYALSSNDGHVLWQTAEPVPVPFFQAGTLYTIENRGQVDAWRIADGKHLWSFSAPAGTTIIQQIHSPSDLLFLLNLTNTLVVLRITDGRMLWRYP